MDQQSMENALRNQAIAETPSKPEPERIFSISFRQLDHGYIIEVGCKTFAIESAERLANLLSAYLLAPGATQKLYFEGKLL